MCRCSLLLSLPPPDLQESASEGLLSSAGRGVEKGSLQKHSSSSRKLGRQEGDGALGAVSGSLGLGPGKSKLKDKLSAIRQDRAERRESLQKQDAIHEVDSSEDETDEGSEDSQDGRRGATFTPPPLLRPTTVRTGPGGTLPSLCLSPCTPHATFTHTGSSQIGRPSPSHTLPSVTEKSAQSPSSLGVKEGSSTSLTEDGARQERKVLEPSGTTKPTQGPLPFSTPGSAFISVSKDTFLKPTPPQDLKSLKGKTGPSEPIAEDHTLESPRTTALPTMSTTSTPDSRTTTSTTDCRTTDGRETPRTSSSSPGIPKEKKEADNRRLCAAAAAASLSVSSSPNSSSNSSSSSPVPLSESGVDRVVSQLATVAKSVLGPIKLSSAPDKSVKDQKPSRGGTPEVPRTDPLSFHSKQVAAPHLSPTRQKTERVASPTTSQRPARSSTQKDSASPAPPSRKDVPERPSSGSVDGENAAASASVQRLGAAAQATLNTSPPVSAASEPQRKRSEPHTATGANAVSASSQQDKATSKKT